MANNFEGATARNLDIGRVFVRTFGIIGRNIGPLAVIGVLFMLLPSLASNFMTYDAMATQDLTSLSGAQMLVFAASFIALLLYLPAALSIAGQDEVGGKVDLGVTFRAALVLSIPLLIHMILWSLGFALGWVLLVIPGIILSCMWAVSFPALVIDRKGIIGSFGHSRYLTKGSRWNIFGIFVVMFVVSILLSGVTMLAGPGLGAFVGTPELGNVGTVFFIISAVTNMVIYTVTTMLFAAMYLELRTIKDGADTGQLEDVFA